MVMVIRIIDSDHRIVPKGLGKETGKKRNQIVDDSKPPRPQ